VADRWAALLARAAVDPEGVPPSYPEILRELTHGTRECSTWPIAITAREFSKRSSEQVARRSASARGRIFIAIDNLVRLRRLRYALWTR